MSSAMPAWLASIPSPSFNTIDIGPFRLTLYGLMIGLGIIAAAYLTRPRFVARGMHQDTVFELLVWVVPAGIVGARLYHVVTDWVPPADWIKVWQGGLGVPGAIAAGALGALAFAKRRDITIANLLDAAVPGVPLAQAIGRIGNWWNQELYGRATDLPWGLEIDIVDSRDAQGRALTSHIETFHPTFLYEMIWNLGLVGLLLWIDRRKMLRPGALIWVYAGGYAIGRLWIETLRIDRATEVAGVRINLWTMGIVLAVSVFMLRGARRTDAGLSTAGLDDHAEDEVAEARSTSRTADDEE